MMRGLVENGMNSARPRNESRLRAKCLCGADELIEWVVGLLSYFPTFDRSLNQRRSKKDRRDDCCNLSYLPEAVAFIVLG